MAVFSLSHDLGFSTYFARVRIFVTGGRGTVWFLGFIGYKTDEFGLLLIL